MGNEVKEMKVEIIRVGQEIIITNKRMSIGQMGRITEKHPDFKGEIVLKAYGVLVSLTNPENTWDQDSFPDMEVELFQASMEILLTVE